jgi:hypothetical protein
MYIYERVYIRVYTYASISAYVKTLDLFKKCNAYELLTLYIL